jgi:myo-inositol-1(or 4)-monophosphatase
MTSTQYAPFLEFAHFLADAAADMTLPHFRNLHAVDNKLKDGDFDPVTLADRGAEKAIRELIETHHPDHAILGEEFGEKSGADGTTLQWVLDPVDGTRAFMSGLPIWGTLIALNDAGTPKIGLMDQPFTGERFYACVGKGAFLRHLDQVQQLSTRPCESLTQATITTTSPDCFEAAELAKWDAAAKKAQLARYGGDCYGYAMVAAGHIDAVIETGLNAYDIQALIPIVEEAGGIVTSWQGGDAAQGGTALACGDPRLHSELLEILA